MVRMGADDQETGLSSSKLQTWSASGGRPPKQNQEKVVPFL